MHVMHKFMHTGEGCGRVADGTEEVQDKVKIWLKVKTMKIPFYFRTCVISTYPFNFGIILMGGGGLYAPSPPTRMGVLANSYPMRVVCEVI